MKNPFSILVSLFILSSLTACNLFSSLSSPSNDEQYLVAARACLDRGDYVCALDNYKALSNSYADVKVNETSLALLAQARVFSFSDLIGSLGTSLGSGSSFATMANLLAARNANTSANRILVQSVFESSGSINNPKLKAFSKFIASLAMFNTVLASAAGDDNSLTATDIVTTPGACASDTSVSCTLCVAPGSTEFTFDAGDTSDLDLAVGWDGAATIQKMITAANSANSEANTFIGSSGSGGLFSSLDSLAHLPVAEGCIRQQLLTILNLH